MTKSAKTSWSQKGWWNKQQNYNFNQFWHGKFWCSQNAMNQPKSTVELGYMCPRGLTGPPAIHWNTVSGNEAHMQVSKRLSFVCSITDEDECEMDNFGCEHFCYNTIGSAHCGCEEGYRLHDNNKNCTGRQFLCLFNFAGMYCNILYVCTWVDQKVLKLVAYTKLIQNMQLPFPDLSVL